jgi:hypothetical protein
VTTKRKPQQVVAQVAKPLTGLKSCGDTSSLRPSTVAS